MALQPFSVAVGVGSNDPLVEATNYKVGAEVYVKLTSVGNPLADVYLDEAGTTPITQPIISNARGMVEFFADAGQYILEYSDGQQLLSTRIGVGATDHQALQNRNTAGAHKAGAISYGDGSVSDTLDASIKSISFVFDDAYESTKTVLKPLFDSYGAHFGMAVPVGSLGNPSRLTLEGVREMASLGYEIINHAVSGDVMNTTEKGVGGVMGELATNWSMLNNIGIKTTGFQTPSSVLNGDYLDIVKQYSDYAFTVGNTQAVLPLGTQSHKLYRFSIEAATAQECVDVINDLSNSDGGIVYYAHDIANGDANYLKIVAIIEQAALLGIPVLLPEQCVRKSITPLSNKVKSFVTGETIDSEVANFSISGGASYSVGGNKDITITIPSAGTYLLQKIVNLADKDDVDDLINFSAMVRDLTGGIVDSASIAIKTYDDVDGGGSVLFTTTEYPADLNNDIVRYYNETVKGLAKSALFFIRLVCNSAGSVLVRQPIIRYGTSIAPEKLVDRAPNIYTSVIPTQTITKDVGYQTVTLTDAPSNGLFSVSGNSVVFQKNATVSIVFSPVASGSNVGLGWAGGSCAMLIGGSTTAIGPIAGGDNQLTGISSVTLNVYRGYSVSFRALASALDFAIGASNSRLSISDIS